MTNTPTAQSSNQKTVETAWVAFIEGPRASVQTDPIMHSEYLTSWLYKALEFGFNARGAVVETSDELCHCEKPDPRQFYICGRCQGAIPKERWPSSPKTSKAQTDGEPL